jgi:hypothetical protein
MTGVRAVSTAGRVVDERLRDNDLARLPLP